MSYARYKQLTGKTKKAYDSDIGKANSKITTDINQWASNPRKYDYIGIDDISQPKGYIRRSRLKRSPVARSNWDKYRVYKYPTKKTKLVQIKQIKIKI